MDIDRREENRRKGPIRGVVERREQALPDKAPVQRGPDRRKQDRREKDRRNLPTATIQEF